MFDRDLLEAETREVGHRVREQLARRRISRQALADMAKISLSTLEKSLSGTRPFTLATTVRLEEALGVPLRPGPAPAPAVSHDLAPEHMGAYARAAVRWIEGRYLTLRPSFGSPGDIFAYVTTIRWLDEAGHLGFAESQRLDARFEQGGHVSMPNLSGHIYLVTNVAGQYRLVILGRPTIEGSLYGLLTTLQVGKGSQLVPVACPIALARLDPDAEPAIGRINPDAAVYPDYREALDGAISGDFVRFPG
ncbi:helix-turn-helix transcriptional regulator [Sphingomonas oligophenolica]|uniref:Helix-turn-helix transcriptional regulator n=1 Tax=Sphingomonas oligophenolica TaxID=301154 RepID=A0ABU9Y0Z3_9SPHN